MCVCGVCIYEQSAIGADCMKHTQKYTMKTILLSIAVSLPLIAHESHTIIVNTPTEKVHITADSREKAEAALSAHRAKRDEKRADFQRRVLEKFDADKDGKLNAEELAAWEAAKKKAWNDMLLEKYDTNKDGVLDEQEKAAMKEDMKPKAPIAPDSKIIPVP